MQTKIEKPLPALQELIHSFSSSIEDDPLCLGDPSLAIES